MSEIHKNMGGFTAIELLVMLMVLTIAFTSFASTFNTIHVVNKQALDTVTANQLAFAKVQEYENKPYASLPNTTPTGSLVQVEDFSAALPTTFVRPRTAIVYINTVSATLKQVVVNIQYGDSASPHIIQYADFIQKNGL